MDAFVGTILGVGFSFPPRGWMTCNGQLLSVSNYSALFALLGTQYGGDGMSTFGLPDLRGRVAVGQNLTTTADRIQGNNGTAGGTMSSTVIASGTATAALTVANLPSHNHPATFTAGSGGAPITVDINVSTADATSAAPLASGYLASGSTDGTSTPFLYAATGPVTKLNAGTATVSGGGGGGTVSVGNTGSGTPVVAPVTTTGTAATVPPFQTIQYIICINGIFPSRN
ncbi:phage tail protein [Janthinobacterium aquaticum]|uniref:phage tail protein n=1 Tax=Janthinobacterium sp. FT58W TaxID=2654254 RepID=UPI001264736E|nr:tail fiber protein [Janthinobacterium sp. FT58W]KAB8044650.1 phage tail protein [Janthinobacterium sp. FT58W]